MIVVESTPLGGDMHEIKTSVADTGIGIPEEAKSRMFRPFSQVDASTTRMFGGTGLGLSISKSLVEAMGGEIWVKSKDGEGSTFYFTIRAAATAPVTAASPISPFEALDAELGDKLPLQILIADDHQVNQSVAHRFLGKLGLAADCVANGQEVLHAIEQKKYDVVFMDCHMPVMDGFEATKRILTDVPPQSRPKIVAMTASTLKEDREKCANAGMDGFIGKPVRAEEISRTLISLFGDRREGEARVTETASPSEDATNRRAGLTGTINRRDLFTNIDGDMELLGEMIDMFLERLPEHKRAIADAIEQASAEELRRSAHSLKSAAGNFFCEEVQKAAHELEWMGRNGELGDAPVTFECLTEKLSVMTEELRELRKLSDSLSL